MAKKYSTGAMKSYRGARPPGSVIRPRFGPVELEYVFDGTEVTNDTIELLDDLPRGTKAFVNSFGLQARVRTSNGPIAATTLTLDVGDDTDADSMATALNVRNNGNVNFDAANFEAAKDGARLFATLRSVVGTVKKGAKLVFELPVSYPF